MLREMEMKLIVALSRLETRLRYLTYASSQYPHDYEWGALPRICSFRGRKTMRKSFFPGAWRPARRRPPSVPPTAQPLLVMFYGIILSYFAFPSSSGGRAPLRSLALFPRERERERETGGACAAAAARSQVLFLSLHSSRATTTFLRRFLNLLLSCSRARDRGRRRERGGFVGTCSLLHSSPALPPSPLALRLLPYPRRQRISSNGG